MQRSFTFTLLLILCLVLLASPVLAQEDIARVRIGYFALDPGEYDTFIDGQPAWFGRGWDAAGWLTFATPGTAGTRVCCSATPYMDFSSGVHRFEFAPRGECLHQAVADPLEATFTPGHVYSLAIVGEVGDGSLNILVIDETVTYSDAVLETGFAEIVVNDLRGMRSMALDHWQPAEVEPVQYGQYAAGWWPADTGLDYSFAPADDPAAESTPLTSIPVPAGLSNLTAFTGDYPGTWGEDYIYAWNYEYPGEVAVVEGGALTLDQTVAGALVEVGQRVQYSLSLDAKLRLNIYARATGDATAGWDLGIFDTMVYVYDDQGHLLFWNDDLATQAGVAGMEDVVLLAGDYVVEVGSFADSMVGPYELSVEADCQPVA
jgi:hypothetical protein